LTAALQAVTQSEQAVAALAHEVRSQADAAAMAAAEAAERAQLAGQIVLDAAAAAGASPEDLVYLARATEFVGVTSSVGFINATSEMQNARLLATGNEQQTRLVNTGNQEVARVTQT